MDDAHNRCRRADPDRDGQDEHGSETGLTSEAPERDTDISQYGDFLEESVA